MVLGEEVYRHVRRYEAVPSRRVIVSSIFPVITFSSTHQATTDEYHVDQSLIDGSQIVDMRRKYLEVFNDT